MLGKNAFEKQSFTSEQDTNKCEKKKRQACLFILLSLILGQGIRPCYSSLVIEVPSAVFRSIG